MFRWVAVVVGTTCFFLLSDKEALADDLPPGWFAADVGAVGIAGSATYSNGQFVISGAGEDIWGTSDGMFSMYRQLGDGEVAARVVSVQSTHVYAKAGVEFRRNVAASSSHVTLDVKPDGGVEFMTRVADNAHTTFVAGTTTSFPVWLKLTHAGGTVTGWISNDNTTWTAVGSTWVQDPIAYAALVVTSHDTGLVNTAVFDSVTVNALQGGPLPMAWLVQNVGDTSANGSASYSNGTFTVRGDGADLWGTADSFTFAYVAVWNQLASLEARVTGIQNTNTYAKAGLMVRSSLDAASPSVILDVKPDGGVEFMTRAQEGGPTSFLAGATVDPSEPVWLRLVVDDRNRVTGLMSDGITWTPVGVTAMPSVNFAGLAVTSHSPGVLNTSTFDQVLRYSIWDY
jgi:hypothetical protein